MYKRDIGKNIFVTMATLLILCVEVVAAPWRATDQLDAQKRNRQKRAKPPYRTEHSLSPFYRVEEPSSSVNSPSTRGEGGDVSTSRQITPPQAEEIKKEEGSETGPLKIEQESIFPLPNSNF